MNCEVVREELSCYVDRVLDNTTTEMIESHLAGCPECRAELKAIEAMQASLLTVAQVDPPASLSFSIREAISREEQSVHAECDHVMAMISEYVDGELAADDVLTVRSHVEACESCAHELALTQSLVHAGAAVAVEPPAELRSRIMAATVENATPFRTMVERVVTALRPARAVLVGATAVAAAAAFLMVGRPNNPPSDLAIDKTASSTTGTVNRNNAAKVEVANKAMVTATLETSHIATSHLSRRWHVRPAVVATAGPVSAPKADSKPTASAAKPADKAADSKEIVAGNTETFKTTEVEVAEKPAEPALITITDAEAKKVIQAAETAEKKEPVQVASGHPVVLPEDNRAMIKSLKQQLRMQKKGEVVSVDLFGSKF